jgi:hypothetical protein
MNRRALEPLVERLWPGAQLIDATPLDPDAAVADDTHKIAGYGLPMRLRVRRHDGAVESAVVHFAASNDFGHDRRADRAAVQLLAWDTFHRIPQHAEALDVGALMRDGGYSSLRDAGELYLVTRYADGHPYAEDLRRIARRASLDSGDIERVEALARYLVKLHARRGGRPEIYRRSIRDLVGGGEGIFGMIDAYPLDTPGADRARLERIEGRCVGWRRRLRDREERLATIHGDFHPFNVLFDERDALVLLDASRGCAGDPADDVTAMAVNFIFFAFDHAGAWQGGLSRLWRRFWQVYLDESGDAALLEVAAPFFAWRALVVASPAFYPAFPATMRGRLFDLVERALDEACFDPSWAEALFT